jgi:hypothetical protein
MGAFNVRMPTDGDVAALPKEMQGTVRLHLLIFNKAKDDAEHVSTRRCTWVDVIEAREWLRTVGFTHICKLTGLVPTPTRGQYKAHLSDLEFQWANLDGTRVADERIKRNDRGGLRPVDVVGQVTILKTWFKSIDDLEDIDSERAALRAVHDLIANDPTCPPNDPERADLLRAENIITDKQIDRLRSAAANLSSQLMGIESLRTVMAARDGTL